MISALVTERIEHGEACRLEAGTLRLRKCRPGEDAVFTAAWALAPDDEVWLVPMDGSLIVVSSGVRVPGSYQQRQGPGMTASAPTEG
jgi:hypothetical protein